MKLKKYAMILLIITILINISSINATDNNTDIMDAINEDTVCSVNENSISQSNDHDQKPHEEILTQTHDDEGTLSDFLPEATQITLTINDTSELETTGNITINMRLSFTAIEHNGEFKSQNISIYENNTLIKTLNIGELNLPELGIVTGSGTTSSIRYQADLTFEYTLHDNSYLTTSFYGTYSNTLQFEKIKTIEKYTLNNTNILINNQPLSTNNTLSNNITSLKRVLELIKNNETLNLNNINLIQDTSQAILLNKNITIIGNNVIFTLQNKGLLFEINPNTNITFVNLTFIGNNPDIIKNNGNVKLLNCTFKKNNLGLITNNGELEITNTKFQEINQIYIDRLTSNQNGLIKNYGTLKITNTTFYNNNDLLPYNLPIESETIKAIIYNNGHLTINNTEITNLKDRIIYNDGKLLMINTIIENIKTAGATAIYKTSTKQTLNNQYTYNTYRINSKTKSIDGAAIYNSNQTDIINSTFQSITGSNGGAIYNTGKLTMENAKLMQSIAINSNGGGIYNTGETLIGNSKIIGTKVQDAIYGKTNYINLNGGGIYNTGTLNISSSEIKECQGVGAAVYNTNIINLENSEITNNHASNYQENTWIGEFVYLTAVHSGTIYNAENANALIKNTIFKENTLIVGTNGNWYRYYGTIKNDGNMEIRGSVFDNNTIKDWSVLYGGDGSINLYNTGTLKIMYTSFINTPEYKLDQYPGINAHTPNDIIFNADGGKSENYYFAPTFEKEYYSIKYNQTENITIKLVLTNGEEIISFDDWDNLLIPLDLNMTITTVNNQGEYINITTLINSEYTFPFTYTQNKATYTISADILNFKTTAIVDTAKEYANMTVTYNNITYNDGNKITFHIKVTGNLTVQPTGNITLTYNNKKVILNLTDGECNFTIDETLKPNNYTMRIDYNGDNEYFKILKQEYNFTVYKIQTSITLSAPEIKIGETGTITITITPRDAKLYGNLYYTTDREYERNADTPGTRTLKLSNFPVGTHNLTVIFKEDEYYTGGTASIMFVVSRYETSLNIESNDIKAGENETLNITIQPGDVRGEATISINNENRTIFLNNTTTPITLTDLEEGTYTVTVYYPGDSKYAPSNATTTFSVSRITSQLNVELTHHENLTGHIKIQTTPLNCTGEVAIYINNEMTLLNLTNGAIDTTIKLKRGTNYIYIHYNGDRTYSISTWNTTINIEATPVLTLETQKLETGKTGYIRINLTDTNNIPYEYTNITIEFQNTTKTLTTNENGTVYLPVNTQSGTYTIKATYQNATISKNITVKTLTQLNITIKDINQADDLVAYATLTDSNNNKLSGEIALEINGNYYKIIITNGEGSRNLGEFTAGTYTYTATYPENTILYSSNTTGSFNVAKNNYKITGNTNIVQYYGATKYYKIILTNNNQPVKGEIINVKINKNIVQVKTDSQGYATLKLSLKTGKYTITSTYKNIKVSNKITVKPTLITKNKKIKKGKTLTYTAKLLNKNGKKLKNKKITFKINGKKYKAKTNKKGIAKIKVKNLKKGKYKIKTTYGKQKNTNTITVK